MNEVKTWLKILALCLFIILISPIMLYAYISNKIYERLNKSEIWFKITTKISNIIQKIKIRLGIIKVHHVNTDKDDLLKAMLEAKSGDIIMVRGDEPLKDIKEK